MTQYEQGFMDKCAEYGVDPEMVKQAGLFTTFLHPIVSFRAGRNASRMASLGNTVRGHARTLKSMGTTASERKDALRSLPAYQEYRRLADQGYTRGGFWGGFFGKGNNQGVEMLRRSGIVRESGPGGPVLLARTPQGTPANVGMASNLAEMQRANVNQAAFNQMHRNAARAFRSANTQDALRTAGQNRLNEILGRFGPRR